MQHLKHVFYNLDSVLITHKESMGSSGGFHMPSAPQFSPGMYCTVEELKD